MPTSETPFERHKRLIRELKGLYGAKELDRLQVEPPTVRTDTDVIADTFRFIRAENAEAQPDAWEHRLARLYYSKLFREYALVDLSRYKTGQIGCRWRTKEEVVAGKGQFVCGAIDCHTEAGLESYEVPFDYAEEGSSKQALVKVRLCQKHALRLNYKKVKGVLKSQKASRAKRKAAKREKHDESPRRKKRQKFSCSPSDAQDASVELEASKHAGHEGAEGEKGQSGIKQQVDDFFAQLLP